MHELKHNIRQGAECECKHAVKVVIEVETNLPYYLCKCKNIQNQKPFPPGPYLIYQAYA